MTNDMKHTDVKDLEINANNLSIPQSQEIIQNTKKQKNMS